MIFRDRDNRGGGGGYMNRGGRDDRPRDNRAPRREGEIRRDEPRDAPREPREPRPKTELPKFIPDSGPVR